MNEKYPQGKLNEHDEGSTVIAIGIENNSVVIRFQKRITWIGMDKASAIAMAQSIIEKANLINEGTAQ